MRPSNRTAEAPVYLPTPPGETEKYAYLAPQRRWIVGTGYVLTLLAVWSQIRFAATSTWTMGLLVASAATVVVATVSAYTSSRRRRVNTPEHVTSGWLWHRSRGEGDYPSVDVFLPSCGEDLDVLANTFAGVARLTWLGRVNVLVLDDSGRESVATLAEKFGFRYLSRSDRGRLKKAGNLLHGYLHSDGDHILVLDADFVPRHDMLSELVPYMDDPTVGIVQSPQFFESVDGMNWLQRGAGVTQEFFYRWVQPSRDAVGAPICVGTCAIYRRAALDAAGGFAQIGHSEDVHTGVKLLQAGFHTRYVPLNLAKGICPDTLDAFINQQYRWCTGSMSLLANREFHAQRLGVRRKLAFYSGFGYYLITALLVFVVPIPTLLMMWGFTENFHPRNYLPIMPIVLWGWIAAPAMLSGRWGPEVFRVQVIYGFSHAMAIWDVLRGRTAAWVPTGAMASPASTPANSRPLASRVRRLMLVWISTTQVLLWAGLFHTAEHNNAPVSSLPVAFVLLLTSVIQLPIALSIVKGMPVSLHRITRGMAAAMATTAAAGIAFTAAAQAGTLVPAAVLLSGLDRGQVVTRQEPHEDDQDTGPATSRTGPGRSHCHPLRTRADGTFLDARYEGERYVIGFTKSVRYCVDSSGTVRLLSARTVPVLRDSHEIQLVAVSKNSTTRSCGEGCLEQTTVVHGAARRQNGTILATAQATVSTRITTRGTTTRSDIDYSIDG